MNLRGPFTFKVGVYALLAAGVVAGIVAAVPYLQPVVESWWKRVTREETPPQEQNASHELAGPETLRLSAEVVQAFQIKPVPAQKVAQSRPLPPQNGTLNYDIN